MGKQQKSRAKKTSQGKHGAGGKMPHLTGIQKILLGQGLMVGVAGRYNSRSK